MNARSSAWVILLLLLLSGCDDGAGSPAVDGGPSDATGPGADAGPGDASLEPEDMGADCVCDAPPPDSCFDGETRLTYDPGVCPMAGAACSYAERPIPCDSPPATTCTADGDLEVPTPTGTCAGGACAYPTSVQACDAPPPPTCVDDRVQRWDGVHRCADGACAYQTVAEACAQGCCEDHCCVVQPSNVDETGPLPVIDLAVGPPNGAFDTDEGCLPEATLGQCEAIEDLCVCRARSVLVNALTIRGRRGLVLLAEESVEIIGVLDVSAVGATPGPGARPSTFEAAAAGRVGASGGAHFGAGAGSPRANVGNAELIPARGGEPGQDGCGSSGGGGGGAVQITAGVRVLVTGAILAGGGGGQGGPSGACNGGAGGGAGGGILIEAPTVEVRGRIFARGGGGGSGGTTDFSGSAGADGGLEIGAGGPRQAEETCPLGETVFSGRGGDGAAGDPNGQLGGTGTRETVCFDNVDATGADGGGGGGIGRIRINTARGAQGCVCAGDFDPMPAFGTIEYR